MLLVYNAGITCGSRGDKAAAFFSVADSNRCVYLLITALDINACHRAWNCQNNAPVRIYGCSNEAGHA